MFGAIANVKMLAAAAVATAGIAAGTQSANADHYRGDYGVRVVYVPSAPVVVQAPACEAPVYTPAPVCTPAPTVVYTQPYYGPQYVVVNDYHHHWAPMFSFRGGRHW